MILPSLPSWCRVQGQTQPKGSCCMEPVSAQPLSSFPGQTQALSHRHSCDLRLCREPSAPELQVSQEGFVRQKFVPFHPDRQKVHGRV